MAEERSIVVLLHIPDMFFPRTFRQPQPLSQKGRQPTFSQDETNVQKLRDLCLRWNKAASDAGFTGSEYIDDPERVFHRVAESRSVLMGVIHRYATTPDAAGKETR